jgi:hypothetical protein
VAFAGLMQLAADNHFDRNIYHQDVVDALLGATDRHEKIPSGSQ